MTPTNGFDRLSEVRRLTALDLDLVPHEALPAPGEIPDVGIDDDDPLLATTRELLMSYGGVIFQGPPGTSKSYYAQNIALKLAGLNAALVRFVQFHPSYQYEDFVEGYIPTGDGHFELVHKHLLEMCSQATEHPHELVVLVIDELSRGEPGRIFGEALTYVEKSKRGLDFNLASGTKVSIPDNLVFLCTMNPLDKGVDDVDAAFERRFAKIAMDPDAQILESFLTSSGMEEDLRNRIATFFRWANGRARGNPLGLGHTFFLDISDEAGLRQLWDHQLQFLFAKAYHLDPDGLTEVHRRWARVLTTDLPGSEDSIESTDEVATIGEVDPDAGQSQEEPHD